MARAALLFAAVAVLAGCGGLSPEQVFSEAQERTAGYDTLRFELTGSAAGVRFEGQGAVDNRAKRLHVAVDVGAQGSGELILDGSVLYARVDGLGRALPVSTPWVSADLRRAGPLLGKWLDELTPLAEEGPGALLERLRAVGDVEELGREQVRGAETTRYRATVGLHGGEEGERTVPVDVWIDGDGLLRRLQAAYGPAAASVTLELFDFGSDVSIEPPAPDAVTSLDDLLWTAP